MSKYDIVGGYIIQYHTAGHEVRDRRDICTGKLIFIVTFYSKNSWMDDTTISIDGYYMVGHQDCGGSLHISP
jgi:hypothetical protein